MCEKQKSKNDALRRNNDGIERNSDLFLFQAEANRQKA